MAKKKTKSSKKSTLIVRLVSTAKTGHFYTTRVKRGGDLLKRKKYDPVIRAHTLYKQSKSKS